MSIEADTPIATPKPPKSLIVEGSSPLEPSLLSPPVAERSSKMKNLVKRISNNPTSAASPCSHNVAFMNPYEISTGPMSKTHCLSCGRYPPDSVMKPYTGTPLSQYGMENRVSMCHPCLLGQGLLTHISSMTGLYASDAHERVALMKGKDYAVKTIEKVRNQNIGNLSAQTLNSSQGLEDLTLTPTMVSAVMNMIHESAFAACRRRSSALDNISTKLENGNIGAAEFLELLNEYAHDAIASSTLQTETIQMKKEALLVAGDMRAAVKMLHEHALPEASGNGNGVASSGSTEMLSCILEFFLDLCEHGELSSVAFFWPQLCQIHLQMLPATDATSLARIELVEDFLLTVCVGHSIHLALEMIWSCVADLEESVSTGNTASPSCRRRRFALIRFVCEMESLIFDLDGGWGGGNVSMRNMFSPSEHQLTLMKSTFGILQMHRRFSSHHLSRSVRLDKLNAEAALDEDGLEAEAITSDDSAIHAAEGKYRIARNAEYFSTQLMFCRRLGDIAEKLRFMEVEERKPALEKELEILNASGRLGGDPLNKICTNDADLVNVLKIPTTEGHVFRSKERTPVLLLMEIRRDLNILHDNQSPVRTKKDSTSLDAEADVSKDLLDMDFGSLESSNHVGLEKDIMNEHSVVSQEVPTPSTPKGTHSLPLNNNSSLYHANFAQYFKASHLKQGGILWTPNGNNAVDDANQVESLVADIVKEKLKISIPDIENNSSASFISCESEIIRSMSTDTDTKQLSDQLESREHTSLQEVEDKTDDNELSEIDMTRKGEDTNKAHSNLNENSPIATEKESPSETVNSKHVISSNFNDQVFPSSTRKVSAFGSFGSPSKSSQKSILSPENLAAQGEGRRQVLTTIFTKGQRSTNIIARGIAPAARRAVQAMDRKRAQKMMSAELGQDKNTVLNDAAHGFTDEGWNLHGSPKDSKSNGDLHLNKPTEEDECIEAIRLLLVQNSVALGKISPENAARAMNLPYDNDEKKEKDKKMNESDEDIDAGDIDLRLAGCGSVSNAVQSALELWKEDLVSNAELLDLVRKDLQYNRLNLPGAENESKLKEDSAFWGRFAFGERWAEKKSRIQASSVFGAQDGWDLTGVIVKSNDDLRQEAFAMQLIELCSDAFKMSGLELWTYPYRILATGRTTGIIEMVQNSMSFDSLKKRPGYEEGGLPGHFKKMTEYAADPPGALKSAKKNFVRSLAAYSLLSYFFVFKDRHNGNILLDTAGHVIHIDFGFIFGIAPGGTFSLEQSIPFKLTEEMIQVMDGLGSVLFSEFVTLFCCGFLALQAHCETFITIVEITCEGSTFNCFEGKETKEITSKLRERFCPHLNKEETISHAMDLIRLSFNATGTKQYDFFQYMSQGIAA